MTAAVSKKMPEGFEKNVKQNIELVDIEDIVPSGGNSLFLCLSRVLIYMSYNNVKFANALETFCGITKNDLNSEMSLQQLLRVKLCKYFYENGINFDKTKRKMFLTNDFNTNFDGNVYDFIVQIHQLSINNFSNNKLFKKHAVRAFSKILNVHICYKKITNGKKSACEWKLFMPKKNQKLEAELNPEKLESYKYLKESTIYLQEFRGSSNNKNVRLLLNKTLWLAKSADNFKICMKFSQFNDTEELRRFQEHFYCVSIPKYLMETIKANDYLCKSEYKKMFCVFLEEYPISKLITCELNTSPIEKSLAKHYELFFNTANENTIISTVSNTNELDFSSEYNTIGKQFKKFKLQGKEKLMIYLNYLLMGTCTLNENFVNRKFDSSVNFSPIN